MAIDLNNMELVTFLLRNGCDPISQTNGGQTPLYRAVGRHLLDMSKLLISHGSQVCAKAAHVVLQTDVASVLKLAEQLWMFPRMLIPPSSSMVALVCSSLRRFEKSTWISRIWFVLLWSIVPRIEATPRGDYGKTNEVLGVELESPDVGLSFIKKIPSVGGFLVQ